MRSRKWLPDSTLGSRSQTGSLETIGAASWLRVVRSPGRHARVRAETSAAVGTGYDTTHRPVSNERLRPESAPLLLPRPLWHLGMASSVLADMRREPPERLTLQRILRETCRSFMR